MQLISINCVSKTYSLTDVGFAIHIEYYVIPVVVELLMIMSDCDDARRSSVTYGIVLTSDNHFIISLCALEWVLDRIQVFCASTIVIWNNAVS